MLLQRQKASIKLMNIIDTMTHTEDISLNDLEVKIVLLINEI